MKQKPVLNSYEKRKFHSLCHRCEYRAQFHEIGHAPRCECGRTGQAVMCCYSYRPVRPVVLRRAPGDNRPVEGPAIIGARMDGLRIANMDGVLGLTPVDGEYLPYLIPQPCERPRLGEKAPARRGKAATEATSTPQ